MSASGEPVPEQPKSSSSSIGRYELLARLGRGGMADVFLALSRGAAGVHKLVVVKRLRPGVAEDRAMVEMFLDEARLATRLNHPNIVHTYEVGEADGGYFIAMEYLQGQPLSQLLRNEKARARLTPAMWCHIMAQALAGLQHAHELKDYDGTPLDIVHRDVSPHNVFITYDGDVKLVDFGIAKATVNTTETATGILKGKVNYMSPEQIRGQVDRRADVFAAGLTLAEALSGKPVFKGEAVVVLNKILNEPIPKLREAWPEAPAELEAIIARATDPKPELRYETADDFRAALVEYSKAAGSTVRDAEVGRAITEVFLETKEHFARFLNSCMNEAGGQSPRSRSSRPSIPSVTLPNGVYPLLGENTSSGTTGSAKRPFSVAPEAVSRVCERPRPTILWGAIAALLLLFGGLAVTFGLSLRHSADGGPTPSGPAPSTPAGRTVVLSLESVPPGAAIERDGKLLGHTPATLELAPGAHNLSLSLAGYATESLVVDLSSGGSVAPRVVTLKPVAAVASGPAPTGKATAAGTFAGRWPPPKTGGGPVVAPSVPASASAAPTAAAGGTMGTLSFNTFPWTRVSEGGRALGTTPLYRVPLSPGPHTLTLDNPDEGIHSSYTVTIKAGELVSRSIEVK
jgi:eukaryotic-like serine/threonine-protein kinase